MLTPNFTAGVVHLGAVAGVMITASHNPAQDNGYKVYGYNGCQINSPADVEIAASILGNLEPMSWGAVDMSRTKQPILTAMKARYYETVNEVVGFEGAPDDVPKFVYTPMHGVGLEFMREALIKTGMIDSMTVVAEQVLFLVLQACSWLFSEAFPSNRNANSACVNRLNQILIFPPSVFPTRKKKVRSILLLKRQTERIST